VPAEYHTPPGPSQEYELRSLRVQSSIPLSTRCRNNIHDTFSTPCPTGIQHEFQRHEKGLNYCLLLNIGTFLVHNKEASVESAKSRVIHTELISVTSIRVIGFAGSILSKFPPPSPPTLRSWRDATMLSTAMGAEDSEFLEPPVLVKWRKAKPLCPRHVISVGLMPLSDKAVLRSRTRTLDAMLLTLTLNSIAGRCRGRNGWCHFFFVAFPSVFFKKKM